MKTIIKLKDLQELETIKYYYIKTKVNGEVLYLFASGFGFHSFSKDCIKIYKKAGHAKAALKGVCNSMKNSSYYYDVQIIEQNLKYTVEAISNAEICSISMNLNDHEVLDKNETEKYVELAKSILDRYTAQSRLKVVK